LTGTITLWVFGLLCFVVAFAKQAASGAGITLPGPETRGARIGIVAVGIVALLLGAAVRPRDGGTSAAATTAPTNATVTTSTAYTSSGPASTAPATSTAAQPAQLWSGDITIPGITAGNDIDFQQIPPGPPKGTLNTGIWAGYDQSTGKGHIRNDLSGHNLLGVWPAGKARPTGAECSDWATTHPQSQVTVSTGAMVCLKTVDGHTALLTIVSQSADDGSIDASATVWAPS
jgi:hypothetical protein